MRRRGWLSANRPWDKPTPNSAVRKGDTVVVMAGKDRGKTGKVLNLFLRDRTVTVEKINLIKRHTKPNQQNRQGGILEREAPVHLSNVMVFCAACRKPTRIGSKPLADGTRTRVCKRCEQPIETAERK